MAVEHVGDSGFEEFFLAVEVVVERAHPDVGGLGDLQYRHVELALRDERLRGLNQRGTRALFAPLKPVDRVVLLFAHGLTIAEIVSFEDFVRKC